MAQQIFNDHQGGGNAAAVWKIDRYASHDGPGIRTLVYFKGCPLRCAWCSNPEGQSPAPVLVFHQEKCTGCGHCIGVCPSGALQLESDGGNAARPVGLARPVRPDRTECDACGACVEACPEDALQVWGKSHSTEDLLAVLERDRSLHTRSGGGLTCTGGDPAYQAPFLVELLDACHRRGVHTAVETSAYADEAYFRSIAERVDWLFIDLKHMDPEAHRRWTGVNNGPILRNAQMASSVLKERGKALAFRQVVVPGANDGQNISDLADFLCSLPLVTTVELLPYHEYGAHKYGLLGRRYALEDLAPPGDNAMADYRSLLRARGLTIA